MRRRAQAGCNAPHVGVGGRKDRRAAAAASPGRSRRAGYGSRLARIPQPAARDARPVGMSHRLRPGASSREISSNATRACVGRIARWTSTWALTSTWTSASSSRSATAPGGCAARGARGQGGKGLCQRWGRHQRRRRGQGGGSRSSSRTRSRIPDGFGPLRATPRQSQARPGQHGRDPYPSDVRTSPRTGLHPHPAQPLAVRLQHAQPRMSPLTGAPDRDD